MKSTRGTSPVAYTPTSGKWFPYLYQSIWRWHFYAGIVFAPFLIILAFSGAVYLFKPQIEAVRYKDMLSVSHQEGDIMSATEMINKTERAYPGTIVSAVHFSDDPTSTVKITAHRDQVTRTLYAHPYTGNIIGSLNNEETFSALFKKIHSQLLIGGTWANRLVELAACWGIILIVTGLYLWWPRNKREIFGTVLPRLNKPGSRLFWRDLHAVTAFWLSFFMLLLIASGLPWSGVLGTQISKLADRTNTNYPPYALSFLPGPQAATPKAKDVAADIPWAAENMPVPQVSAGDYMRMSIDDIKEIADHQQVQQPYTITLPKGETGVYTISTTHTRPGKEATLHIDPYSGAVLTDVRYADYGMMAKTVTLGIALHEGRLFGWLNQLLGLITCLGVILMAVSSYVMWRKRKPAGKLGAPTRAKDKRITMGLLVIMLLFGTLMPLVGLSILFVLILDLLIIRRIAPLKNWFTA